MPDLVASLVRLAKDLGPVGPIPAVCVPDP